MVPNLRARKESGLDPLAGQPGNQKDDFSSAIKASAIQATAKPVTRSRANANKPVPPSSSPHTDQTLDDDGPESQTAETALEDLPEKPMAGGKHTREREPDEALGEQARNAKKSKVVPTMHAPDLVSSQDSEWEASQVSDESLHPEPEVCQQASVTKRVSKCKDDAGSQTTKTSNPQIVSTSQKSGGNVPQNRKVKHHIRSLWNIHIQENQDAEKARNTAEEWQTKAINAEAQATKKQRELQKLRAQLKKTKTLATSQEEKLERSLNDLQKQFTELEAEKKDLRIKLNSQFEQLEDLQAEYCEVLWQMKPDRGDPNKVTDNVITALWKAMDFDIDQISCSCKGDDGFEWPQWTRAKVPLKELLQDCNQYPGATSWLVQRFVWRRLCSDVFHGKNGVWGGNLGDLFKNMVGVMRDLDGSNQTNLEIISRMKFHTAKIIDIDVGLDLQVLRALGKGLFDDMMELAPACKHNKLRASINKAFETAAELLVIFVKSRAIFTVDASCLYHPLGPRPFDPAAMLRCCTDDWHQEVEEQEVHLLVSPPVRKTGNVDGYDFGSSFFVCKARAVMERKTKASEMSETRQAMDAAIDSDSLSLPSP